MALTKIGKEGITGIDNSSNATAITIDSSENVGIGTTSPTVKLHIDGGDLRIQDTTPNVYLYSEGGVNNVRLNGNISDSVQGGLVISENGNNLISTKTNLTQFYTTNTERMRIDSSGNLLINTTSTSNADDGFRYNASSGWLGVTRNAGQVLYLNRRTSDGTILELRKDNTIVGSINSNGGTRTILNLGGNNNAGITGANGANQILPTLAGSTDNNTVDLGTSTVRWKDLYLGGGLYVGGTGSANKLDDYEEGTWTPTMGGTTTYYARSGEYTKVGNKVFVRGQVSINAIGTGSTVQIQGLPFTSKTTSNGNPAGALNITYYSGLAIAVNFIAGHVTSASSNIQIIANAGNNTTVQYNTGNFFGNGTRLDFTMVYQAA